MAYLLLAFAIVIVLVGVSRLTPSKSRTLPWGALIVWALLLAGGATIWLMTTGPITSSP